MNVKFKPTFLQTIIANNLLLWRNTLLVIVIIGAPVLFSTYPLIKLGIKDPIFLIFVSATFLVITFAVLLLVLEIVLILKILIHSKAVRQEISIKSNKDGFTFKKLETDIESTIPYKSVKMVQIIGGYVLFGIEKASSPTWIYLEDKKAREEFKNLTSKSSK